MRILFLSPRQSVPARSGARLREFHFLKALGQSAEITYLYFADPESQAPTLQDLPFCREAIGIPKPPAYGFAKTLRGIFGRWPLPILNYSSAAMSAAVARVMENRSFDIIHLDSIHMTRYVKAVARPGSPRAIYNWHNIESEAMRRYSATTSSASRRYYAWHTAGKMARVEKQILGSAFGHVVCSERERNQLLATAPDARVTVVENGVDTGYFAGAGVATSPGVRRIVFVGAMDYFPNSDAAVFFATRIWPEVRRKLSGIELAIVGANPVPAVVALGALPGVRVTGMVPDVRPWYAGALAAVVPLRNGGGTRLKILEAMAAGVPVLSTALGAEGLEVVDERNALLVNADDATGWASRLVSLAHSPDRCDELAREGLQLVRKRYDWAMLGAKLRTTYENWLSGSER